MNILTAENLTGFAMILMRMTGCVVFNPILGRRNFPAMFKVGLAMVLTLIIFTYTDVTMEEPNSVIEYMIPLLKEFAIGYVLGFTVTLFTYVIIFGGEFVDLQMGMSMSKVYDPQSNISMSITSTYYNILFIFLFFISNGHITMIEMFLTLEEIIPYGGLVYNKEMPLLILEFFSTCTILGIKLAMPILTVEFLLEMGVGLLMKVIPQINVFVVNIQAKVLLGLVMLFILYAPAVSFLENLITIMFESLNSLAVTMAA